MPRYVGSRSVGWWFILVSLGLMACSTDDDLAGPARGPKNLRISRIDSAATFALTDPIVPLELDCQDSLLVSLEPYDAGDTSLGDFALAQPGGCSDTNCGWILLTVPRTSVEVAAIQSPIQVDLPAELRQGDVTFRVELRDFEGEPVLREDGKRLRAESQVQITTPDTCLAE